MAFDQGTVFVLGAGFTKAFLPAAPLMVDDYGGKELLGAFGGSEFSEARKILELELQASNGKINLERILTRLHGRMPYDLNRGTVSELDLLRSKIEWNFRERLMDAMQSCDIHTDELLSFAAHCINNEGVNCVTFNYDTLLDQALWGTNRPPWFGHRWTPNSGYGFPCWSSKNWFEGHARNLDQSRTVLLKLHGSINWRIPLGQPRPHGPHVIMHHEDWSQEHQFAIAALEDIAQSLERDFFFVPPILTKGELVEQPILRLLWSKAHELLSNAKRVVFIGYSMPLTDIASGFLFRESLQHLAPEFITVVTRPSDETGSQVELAELLRAYQNVFPRLTEANMDRSGARKWVFDNLTQWLYDSHGQPIAFIYGTHVIAEAAVSLEP